MRSQEETARTPYRGGVHTRARVAGVLILAAALGGCAAPTPAPAPTQAPSPQSTPAPASPAHAPATQAPTQAPVSAAPVVLPWPAATPAQAARLQTAVDGGAQPWLLDPTQVALAYAAARGWRDAVAEKSTAPTAVTIRSSAGTHVLALAQPGKPGAAGIWVVIADR